MLKLQEMEQRILSELEEAWAENVATLVNTVQSLTGDFLEVDSVIQALRALITTDYVDIAVDRDVRGYLRPVSKGDALAVINTAAAHFRYSNSAGHWRWNDLRPPWNSRDVQIPEVLATQLGLEKAREILEQRGYQWWRQKT